MVFTTLPFIVFFAIVFFGYYALPSRYRWWLLLVASWVFYAYMTPYYLIFLTIATAVTYFAALGIDNNLRRQREWISVNGKSVDREAKKSYKAGMERKRNQLVASAVVGLIGMLVAFKYLDFLFANVGWLGGVLGFDFSLTPMHLILPIGLSFYVFQSLGYCIDVSREMVPAERNFCRHALFVSYFPQVLQGPIGDYGRLAPQLFVERDFSYRDAVFGLQRVVWGFFKKLVIANGIAQLIDPVWGSVALYPGSLFWAFVLVLYSIQLYADFSGYMDIACGCSQMLGIKLDENFNCPYFSKSIAEFWRNWHITLGVWFKNYVFYPLLRSDALTGLRKRFKGGAYLSNTVPTVSALLVVWLLIGLWHGADWSYVLYGLYHGAFIIAAVIFAPLLDRFHVACRRIVESRPYVLVQVFLTFAIATAGYVIFRPANLAVTGDILGQSLQGLRYDVYITFIHKNWMELVPVFFGTIVLFFVDLWHRLKPDMPLRVLISSRSSLLRWCIYVTAVFLVMFMGIYGQPGLDQFAYFKF